MNLISTNEMKEITRIKNVSKELSVSKHKSQQHSRHPCFLVYWLRKRESHNKAVFTHLPIHAVMLINTDL